MDTFSSFGLEFTTPENKVLVQTDLNLYLRNNYIFVHDIKGSPCLWTLECVLLILLILLMLMLLMVRKRFHLLSRILFAPESTEDPRNAFKALDANK